MVMKSVLLIIIWTGFFLSSLFGQQYEVTVDSAFKARFDQVEGGWLCADASYSLHLPDGRTLWLYGDTFIGEKDYQGGILPGYHFIRNSAIVDQGGTLQTLYSGTPSSPKAFIPTGDSTWYWPEHGMVENDTIKLFMGRFKSVDRGTPGFNFGFVGIDVVWLSPENFGVIGSRHLGYTDSSGVRYGNQVLRHDGYAYIYGRKDENIEGVTFKMPHVARVEGNLSNPWQFYNGNEWVNDPAKSQRISDRAVTEQYAVFKRDKRFYLLTHEAFLGKNIYLVPGNAPEGRFNNLQQQVIYTTPETYNTYNTWIHPQFTDDGEYLLSYNVNGGFSDIVDNTNLYRPRFLRLDFTPDTATTLDKPSSGLEASVFPNPASAVVNIRVEEDHRCVAALYDNNGRLVAREKFTGSTSILVSGYPAGVYHLRLRADKQMHRQNIIIR